MKVTLPNLTRAQAIALHAMFEHWRYLGAVGSSRIVSFMVDGDGNFRPKPEVIFTVNNPYDGLTEERRRELLDIARGGEDAFDFDPVAWALHDDINTDAA